MLAVRRRQINSALSKYICFGLSVQCCTIQSETCSTRPLQSSYSRLFTLFHNPMKCEKWDTALTIMYPYHCNSRTHSIVIASHDFQLQTDWFECKLEQFLLLYFPRPAWHFSRVHRNKFYRLFHTIVLFDNLLPLFIGAQRLPRLEHKLKFDSGERINMLP